MNKWVDKEIEEMIILIDSNLSISDISVKLNRSYSSVKNKMFNLGLKIKVDKESICLNCYNIFNKKYKEQKFCSKSCSVTYNNNKKRKKTKICIHCGNILDGYKNKFCSRLCQTNYYKNIKIKNWLNGDVDGVMGKYQTHKWIKDYLIKKYGEKCMECEWDKRNTYTNKIPIELEHIDGNFRNNKEENLRLLCPNCHSLTKTYKGSNRGKGRNRKKYY